MEEKTQVHGVLQTHVQELHVGSAADVMLLFKWLLRVFHFLILEKLRKLYLLGY